jgi:GNAT superfamily N-acetyltransferase
MEIVAVQTERSVALVRALFEEYWTSFGFTPCFQGFAQELTGLPGAYAPPDGRLALAMVEGEAAGCIAMRRYDERRCEGKRLFVRPQYRGLGIGRALLEWLIAEARAAGYREMVGDTLPVMDRALAMYDRIGFERVPLEAGKHAPGSIALRLKLTSA